MLDQRSPSENDINHSGGEERAVSVVVIVAVFMKGSLSQHEDESLPAVILLLTAPSPLLAPLVVALTVRQADYDLYSKWSL